MTFVVQFPYSKKSFKPPFIFILESPPIFLISDIVKLKIVHFLLWWS